MRRSRRAIWWCVFGAGSAAVVAGLGWITAQVLRLDREEALARAEIARQETLHLALWRMDSWLAPLLAREGARTWFEYQSYYPETLALNRLCEPIAAGEVVVPSPLLEFRSELFPLHVQFTGRSGFTSPQVPSPEIVAAGVVGCVPMAGDDAIEGRLRQFAFDNDGPALLDRVEDSEKQLASAPEGSRPETGQWVSSMSAQDLDLHPMADALREIHASQQAAEPPQAAAPPPPVAPQQAAPMAHGAEQRLQARDVWDSRNRKLKEESDAEFKARQAVASKAQSAYLEGNLATTRGADLGNTQLQTEDAQVSESIRTSAEVGPLVPIWLGSPPNRLLLARRVQQGSEEILQGVVVEWSVLKRELLDQIADLYPVAEARLEPVTGGTGAGGAGGTAGGAIGGGATGAATSPGMLASLPIRFLPPSMNAETPPIGQGILLGLAIVWAVSLGAIATTSLAMRSTLHAAMQTSRFASSVTHELRTPLTTFRLYAEMLSDGVVGDPERAREYLRTLRDESTRLGLLVENVLAWSRLEEGRKAAEPRTMEAGDLVTDAEPVLQRRCDEAGASLVTRVEDAGAVRADPSRVRQILFNLVDNACKYAGEHAQVEVSATRRNGSVVLAVDDDGPGVPAALRRSVFKAFDRGTLGPGDSVRGLGLGLSISLELAKSLDGRIHCLQSPLGGARFELELPAENGNHGAGA